MTELISRIGIRITVPWLCWCSTTEPSGTGASLELYYMCLPNSKANFWWKVNLMTTSLELHFLGTLLTVEFSILKAPIWNNSTESLQWNFDVKVYEIDSFFYVFVLCKYNKIITWSTTFLFQMTSVFTYLYIKLKSDRIVFSIFRSLHIHYTNNCFYTFQTTVFILFQICRE